MKEFWGVVDLLCINYGCEPMIPCICQHSWKPHDRNNEFYPLYAENKFTGKKNQNQTNTFNCLITISITNGKKACFVENEEYINAKKIIYLWCII